MRSKKRMTNTVFAALMAVLMIFVFCHSAQAAPVAAPVSGEIEQIFINDINDHWSGGEIVVGGQNVIIPRNLLIDLPANRLTLKQIFDQAHATCIAAGESGLAKGDTCNTSATGGFATISANMTNAGDIIAGDIFIEKGREVVMGRVSYINYADGYFRLNGILNDPNTGVMARLNDPTARHTIQQGLGCTTSGPAEPNCSPDPRFTLDADNYVSAFITGYPFCIPSTVQRTFVDVLGLGTTTAQALADGTGDVLCPSTNRSAIVPEPPVADSRRFAPIKIGDSLTAEGNFETINGVKFLSAHTTLVARALQTQNLPTQPDYFFLDEVEVDVPGFQNQRIRTLIIGYATLAPTDVLVWSIHYDPATNEAHEFPLATVRGCDTAAGAGTCGAQGLVGAGANIFKIRHDIDFLVGAKPRLNPCAHLIADPRIGTGFCPNGGGGDTATPAVLADQIGILSPIPHELQARSGHSLANPGLITLDIKGSEATNGQYLFPLGMNLGGIATPEFVEIDLDAVNFPFMFSGIPWNLDRRLSPQGCIDINNDGTVDCETTPQPLDPFPFEGFDPRTQATMPTASYNDPNFTATSLSNVRNRILSYVTAITPTAQRPDGFNFNGNNTLLTWPPTDPAAIGIIPTPPLVLICGGATTYSISGGVTSGASPLPGVTMTLSGSATGTAVTDALGNYGFGGLPSGTYTVTPGLANFTFAPPSSFQVLNAANVTGVNFAATPAPTFSISGNVTSGGNPLAGVTMTLSGAGAGTATTDAAGNYTFPAVTDGNYTVTPSLAGFTFAPPSSPVPLSGANVTGVNFTGTPVPNAAPTIISTPVTAAAIGQPYSYDVNAADPDGDTLTYSLLAGAPVGMTINVTTGLISWTPTLAQAGPHNVTARAQDPGGLFADQSFTVTVPQPDTLAVTRAQFGQRAGEWRIEGTSLPVPAPGTTRTVTIFLGPSVGGTVIGAATVATDGRWQFRQSNSPVVAPATNARISIQSSSGGKIENVSVQVTL